MHDVWRCCWNFVESTCQLSESDGKWVCEPNACEHRLTYFFSCVGAIICWFLLLPTYFLFISFAVLQLSTLSDANGNASSRRRSTSTRSQFRDFFFLIHGKFLTKASVLMNSTHIKYAAAALFWPLSKSDI